MTYKEAEQLFMEKEGKGILAKCIQELQEYFWENQQTIGDDFLESCHVAVKKLKELPFLPGYCVYTMFRTDFLEDRYRYFVKAYDEEWYYGRKPVELFCYDGQWGFQFFRKMWQEMGRERKRYMGKVNMAFVDNLAMHQMMEFNNRMAQLLLEWGIKERIRKVEDWDSLNPNMRLYMGEYMGKVYQLNNSI